MIIEAIELNKSFFEPKRLDILRKVSLHLRRGESIAICGRSGEGKTTLLHLLGTLEQPDSGELFIAGTKASSKNAYRLRQKEIGFIFQSFNLLEDFTALDNVLMPSRIARSFSKSAETYALALLDEVGLAERAHTRAKLLSGGERQRVAIARALSNNPSLILADEPTGNLDRDNARRIGELLISSVKEKNKSLVLVTHDPDLASLCDSSYLLQDGQLYKS